MMTREQLDRIKANAHGGDVDALIEEIERLWREQAAAVRRAQSAASVQGATAHDLSEDLTIVRSAIQVAMREMPIGRLRSLLMDAEVAATRASWSAAQLLHLAQRAGARPTAATGPATAAAVRPQ